MQKIIKLETENTPLERWTENSACEIYSHDTNNGQFEIEVMNEALTDETVTALFIFEESESVWRTTGTIEENKIKFKFDTTLITQDETVLCVLYLDNERENNDFYRFNFKVKVSEIDKLDNLTVKERFFKNNLIVDRLDVVTKDELQEILKHIDLSSISTDGLLTEEKANGLYAKISELEALERQIPSVSAFVTEETLRTTKNDVVAEINNRLENYALKTSIPEPYNDTNLVNRVSDLEQKQDKDTIYNDGPIKERLRTLENSNFATKEELANIYQMQHRDLSNYALKTEIPQPYNDTVLVQKIGQLEAKVDNDTIYDDTPLKERVETLENKVDKDTVYNDEPIKARLTALESKPNVDLTDYVTKQELKNKVNTSDYETFKNMVVTKGYLEKQNFLTEQYNDKPLTDRVVALENKQDNDTIYDDSELKRRVTTLETRTENLVTKQELHEATEIDYSNIVTTDELEEKHYVTETELNNKGFLTQHQDISKLATRDEIKNFVTRNELPTPYNDTNLSNRVTALENKTDRDTVYNDTELRNRVATLESRPNIEVSNFATKQQLSDYALKTELPAPYNDSALVSRVSALEIKQDKDTVYNDTEVKRRLTALESRPTAKNGIRNALVIGWQDIFIQNMRFTSQINLVDVVNNVTLRNINGLDIKRVNNATYGYVIFNNRTKQFTLEILETDLSKKTSDDYLITVMWNNGYYTDNGALKNKR